MPDIEALKITYEYMLKGRDKLLHDAAAIDKAMKKLGGQIGTNLSAASSKGEAAMASMQRQVKRLQLAINQLQGRVQSFAQKGVSDTGLRSMSDSLDVLKNRMDDLREISGEKKLDLSVLPFDKMEESIVDTGLALQSLPKDTSAADRALLSLTQQARTLSANFDQLQQRIATFASQGGSQKSIDALGGNLQNLNNRLVTLKENAQAKGVGGDMAQTFGELEQKSGTAGAAIGGLSASSKTAAQSLLAMKSAFMTAAAAAGILLIPLKLIIAEIKKDIDVFMTMTEELRKLKIVMGATSAETSAWAKMARDWGVSATVMERGIIQLEQGLVEVYQAELDGEKSTSSFGRALATLGINVTNTNGTMRSASDIMSEVSQKLNGMESNGTKVALTTQLFGRYNRDLVLGLVQSSRSLEETERLARKFGVTLTTSGVKSMTAWQLATSDLKDSMTGLKATVGQAAAEAFTPLIGVVTNAVAEFRKLYIAVSAASQALFEGIFTSKTYAVAAREAIARIREQFSGLSDLQKAQEAYDAEVQQAAIDEDIRAQKIEDTVRALKDLKAAFEDQMDEMAIQMRRSWDDLFRGRIREAIERAIQEAWETGDLLRDLLRSQADIIKNYYRKLEDLRVEQARKQDDFERDSRKKKEDLEKKHQDRLIDIRNRYYDSLEEAVRTNDAVAVLRAMRERARNLRDEKKRYQDEQDELKDSLDEKKRDLERDRKNEAEDARKARDRQLADAQEGYEQSLRDLAESRRRARVIREIHYRWEEEDLRRSQQQQIEDARRAYNKEKADLSQHLNDLKRVSTTGIQATGQAIAKSTSAAISTVGTAAVVAINAWARRILLSSETGMRGNVGRSITGGVIGGRDAGGIDILNRPSKVAVAGSGPEAMISVPIPRGQMSIDHSFSPLPINVSGAGGMTSPQVQQIVEAAMYTLAKQLSSRMVRR